MRFSKLFGKTLREAPADVTWVAEQLAMRAALLRRGNSFTRYLPLGYRALQRIRQIASEVFSKLGAQEADNFTNLETFTTFKSDLVSYRDLPRLIFSPHHIRKISAIAFDSSQVDYESMSRSIYQGLQQIYVNCGISVSVVENRRGKTYFITPHPHGYQELLICTSSTCGYADVAQQAVFNTPDGISGDPLPLKKVETPHCSTIATLAEFLKIETCQTIKAVMFVTDQEEFIFVVIRGDLEVSIAKLSDALNITSANDATEAEILAIGAVPGYASPTRLKVAANEKERGKGNVTVIADQSILSGNNFAAGANEAGYHFINVNYPRDFQATLVADIALAKEGAACIRCGSPLKSETAFVLGSCHAIGPTELTYLANTGRPEPVWLGAFDLDPQQMLLAIIDQHHDEAGIVWPASVAPYDIHLVRLGKAPETLEAADKLYADLQATGKTVFYDDRDESAGVKFADADLIGLPIRLTISDKSLKAGGVELKRRTESEKVMVGLEEILKSVGG
jgi:prolyl-tRNA synthetase